MYSKVSAFAGWLGRRTKWNVRPTDWPGGLVTSPQLSYKWPARCRTSPYSAHAHAPNVEAQLNVFIRVSSVYFDSGTFMGNWHFLVLSPTSASSHHSLRPLYWVSLTHFLPNFLSPLPTDIDNVIWRLVKLYKYILSYTVTVFNSIKNKHRQPWSDNSQLTHPEWFKRPSQGPFQVSPEAECCSNKSN